MVPSCSCLAVQILVRDRQDVVDSPYEDVARQAEVGIDEVGPSAGLAA
mgnify:CR=1 FL=1